VTSTWPRRFASGIGRTAPAALCTRHVTTDEIATSAKSGSFSRTSGPTSSARRQRPSGQ
jgi:hypothetical protein